ncbi:hypothetical protein NEPTK9_001188 [Candidatus Neptunochlamydia vexilliferae]|uniref:Uncharacterized protein n=1 Tax=Candidatus Neptunichlamydia vexilliferae TaxID=1651774 RepID=A0ABS0AZV9_9BACT|nr:hypothetical protein [Candidatus Neptunochlamydia vexilliferae]
MNFSFSLGLDGSKSPYFTQVCGIFNHQSLEKNRKPLQLPIVSHQGLNKPCIYRS